MLRQLLLWLEPGGVAAEEEAWRGWEECFSFPSFLVTSASVVALNSFPAHFDLCCNAIREGNCRQGWSLFWKRFLAQVCASEMLSALLVETGFSQVSFCHDSSCSVVQTTRVSLVMLLGVPMEKLNCIQTRQTRWQTSWLTFAIQIELKTKQTKTPGNKHDDSICHCHDFVKASASNLTCYLCHWYL